MLPPLLILLSVLALTAVNSFVVRPCASGSVGPLARSVLGRSGAAREGGEVDRKALVGDILKKAGFVVTAWGMAAAGLPQLAGAKKIINLEEARELGEKKMIEIEKAKGPLIKVRLGDSGSGWVRG